MTSARNRGKTALFLIALGGCSGGAVKPGLDGGGAPGTDAPLEQAVPTNAARADDAGNAGLAAFADAITAITCSKAFDCCSASELAALVGAPVTTPEMCRAHYQALDVAATEARIAAGQLVFHPELVADCLDAARAAKCSQVFDIDPIPACLRVLAGPKAVGAACQQAGECTTNRCAETCQPVDACDGERFPCPADSYCALAQGRCLALKDGGAACDPMAPVGGECKPALYCSQAGVCTARGGPGSRCGFDVVDDGTCAPEGGSLCAGDSACADGLFCSKSSNGTCVARPADGAPCARLRSCGVESYCDLGAGGGTCKPRIADGAACTGPGQCANGSTCFPGPTGGLRCAAGTATAQCNGKGTKGDDPAGGRP